MQSPDDPQSGMPSLPTHPMAAQSLPAVNPADPRLTSLIRLTEQLADAVLLADLHGTILYANAACHTLLGCEGSLVGIMLQQLHADPPELIEQMVRHVQQHQTWHGSCTYRCKAGKLIHAHAAVTLLSTSADTPPVLGYHISNTSERLRVDEALREAHAALAQRVQERERATTRTATLLQSKIDELRHTQHELRSSENRQRTLLNALPDALFMLTAEGQIEDAHIPPEYALPPAHTLVGQPLTALIADPATATQLRQCFQQVLYMGQIGLFEYRTTMLTSEHFYEARIVPASPTHVLMLIRDITGQRAVEKDLARFFVLSPDLLIVVGDDAEIKHCNAAWHDLMGYPEAFLIGKRTLDFIHPEDTVAALQMAHMIRDGNVANGIEYRFRHADGSYRWLRWSAISDSDTYLIHAIARDITLEKQATLLSDVLSEAIQQTTDAVLIIKVTHIPSAPPRLTMQFANVLFQQLTGYAPKTLHHEALHALQSLWGADFEAQLEALCTQLNPTEQQGTLTMQIDMAIRYFVDWRCVPLLDYQGVVQHMILRLHNVTPYIRAHRLAVEQLEVLEALVRGDELTLVLSRIATLIERHIPQSRTVLQIIASGKVVQRAAPRLPQAYSNEIRQHFPMLYHDVERQPVPGTPCAAALAQRQTVLVENIVESHAWPIWRKVALRYDLHACWTAPILHADGSAVGVIVVYSTSPGQPDSDDLALLATARYLTTLAVDRLFLNEQISYQSHHDSLTGLLNRAGFEQAVQHVLEHNRARQHAVVLGIINLDRFKQINSVLGHQAGDMLINLVAQRLRAITEPRGILARLSGDEFALLLPQASNPADALRIAQHLLDALRSPFTLDAFELIITASIGLSFAPSDADTVSGLLQCADRAMTRAKANGANQVVQFTPEMSALARERLELEQQLHIALQNNELLLYYQPQWDMQSGALYGVEALIRWQHPVRGLLAAGQFLPVAEAGGLTFAIGSWVLQEALRQAAAWYASGYPLRMGVNVSAAQLLHPNFIQSLEEMLNRYRLPAELIELELIESTALQDHATGAQRLRDVRALGIRIAIDDFGTGYSSLAYLQRLHVDSLKIDRSFVDALGSPSATPSDTVPLVQTIISLAHNFRLTVVAEGVETKHQLDFLQRAGCEVVQGFLTGKPMPTHALTAMLHQSPCMPHYHTTTNGNNGHAGANVNR
ncbi:MAG: EAL domain-containing protein [Chloroflexaceae bacterium]|nr:EAL domain-containing protein [Chloroflexaceae bacterium]